MTFAYIGILSVLSMICGHIFKIQRWRLLISLYEIPSFGNLLEALSLGHCLNAILPVRMGDIVSVYVSGRKLKNGCSFSFATILVNMYIDFLSVSFMFLGLSLIGKGGHQLQVITRWYILLLTIVIPLTIICICFRRSIKKMISLAARIFNERIEFRILYITYLTIASVKDIAKKINKKSFLLYTAGMWCCYVSSYIIFAEMIQRMGFGYTTSDVFTLLFSGLGFYHMEADMIPIWAVYILAPFLLCLVWAICTEKKEKNANGRFILPQMSKSDRLAFLRTYYKNDDKSHLQAYLDINEDVAVVEDSSAGSNASTVLVLKDGKMYFRKYAFDEDAKKLTEQIAWIEEHQSDIPLPVITGKRCEDTFSTYDMPSYAGIEGLFKYIHIMPPLEGWKVLKQVLMDIDTGLHVKNRRACEMSAVQNYIDTKVVKNLEIIKEKNKYIRSLEKYDAIYVNGKKLRTLKFYKKMFDVSHLKEIFANDIYADIHGDLTVENIVCLTDASELEAKEFDGKVLPKKYYFIDPNTGNLHDSPFLDYAKLLQSLHGNYEFLMMVTSVSLNKEKVNFMFTKSEAYGVIYRKYQKYLNEHFRQEEVLSIYYHEIIHWLRLIPYKIQKNEKTAVVFYAGLLEVLADVWEMEYGRKK